MITLYSYYRSPASYRVRIALNIKELKYEYKAIHLVKNGGEQHAPEYKKLNPQEMVPALADGKTVLTQSLAIIEYLDEKHPEPALLPGKADQRAYARQIAQVCASDMHPLDTLRVLNYISGEFSVSQAQRAQWQKKWLIDGLAALEKIIESSPHRTGDFCCGKTVTLADICLIPQLYGARRLGVDISAWPTLAGIETACLALEAFQKASPEDQPDTPEDQRLAALKGHA
jgi:maleylacetoacetate isomerase